MARKPYVISAQQRAARNEIYRAAPVIGQFTGVEEVSVELKFVDPEGRQQPSPRSLTFAADMQAFFDIGCSQRDCEGGGFDANADLLGALKRHASGHTGKLTCGGVRPRNGLKDSRCNIELHYTLWIRAKAAAAA